jgi:hypothetical protein
MSLSPADSGDEPLTLLREQINDGSGGPIRLIHLSEDHIWKDAAEAHVYDVTPEKFCFGSQKD